jgi:hypothetical protein
MRCSVGRNIQDRAAIAGGTLMNQSLLVLFCPSFPSQKTPQSLQGRPYRIPNQSYSYPTNHCAKETSTCPIWICPRQGDKKLHHPITYGNDAYPYKESENCLYGVCSLFLFLRSEVALLIHWCILSCSLGTLLYQNEQSPQDIQSGECRVTHQGTSLLISALISPNHNQ